MHMEPQRQYNSFTSDATMYMLQYNCKFSNSTPVVVVYNRWTGLVDWTGGLD